MNPTRVIQLYPIGVIVKVTLLLHEGTQVCILPKILTEIVIEGEPLGSPLWGLERFRSRQIPHGRVLHYTELEGVLVPLLLAPVRDDCTIVTQLEQDVSVPTDVLGPGDETLFFYYAPQLGVVSVEVPNHLFA